MLNSRILDRQRDEERGKGKGRREERGDEGGGKSIFAVCKSGKHGRSALATCFQILEYGVSTNSFHILQNY